MGQQAKPTRRAGRREPGPRLSTIGAIARLLLRQSWRQLLVTDLGVLAVVSLICAAPLFSRVAMSAGLRNALSRDGAGANVTVLLQTNSPSKTLSDQALELVRPLLRHAPPSLRVGAPHLSVQAFGLHPVMPPSSALSGGASNGPPDDINLIGASIGEAAPHITLLDGALPAEMGDEVQIAVTRATADSLHLRTGSRLELTLPTSTGKTLPLRVVGIFALASANDPFFGQFSFQPTTPAVGGTLAGYDVLASNDVLMAALARAGADPALQQSTPLATLRWTYPLDIASIDAGDLTALTTWAQSLQIQIPSALQGIQGATVYADPTILYLLQQYQLRILLLQIPITLILILALGLVVLFVANMADLLIESQTASIALLRSRGANVGVILGALSTQAIGLGALALVAGPLVAVALVEEVARLTLPPGDLGSLSVIADHPVRAAMDISWFALGAALVATGAVIIAVRRAASLNVLALRRQTARASHEPAWKKLNLDIIGLVITIASYIGYAALVPQLNPQVRVALSPFAFIAAFLLLGSVALLFLRFFPAFLRVAAWIAGRGRNVGPALALIQLARAPRQAARIILLLGLATAFLIFANTFDASQTQRPQDEAAYQVGADFRGTVAHPTSGESPALAAAPYASLPGVDSASAGYTVAIDPRDNEANINVALQAIDADSFGRAAMWTPQSSPDTLPNLMATLADARAAAGTTDEVPAVIDAAFAEAFHVQDGAHFTLTVPGYTSGGMRFVVVAEVRHIPSVYDNADQNGYGTFGGAGGALVDYTSFAAAFKADHPHAASTPPAPNTIWLRTSDNPALLASIRQSLGQGDLALSPLLDRRQEIAVAQNDPLWVDLLSVLRMAAAAALLLALVGSLVSSWVSSRSRVTQFALLRALGVDPRRMAATLIWEQSLMYAMAFALGIALGAILSTVVLPALVFANMVSSNGNAFLKTLDVPPIQIIFPFSELALGLGGAAILCALALIVTALVIATSSVSQSLRLNED